MSKSAYTIQNDILKITVKSKGAELCGLVDKRDQTEHIWQAEPEVWGKHAPILFPVIGKVNNDSILIDGLTYPHPKHGFFRPSSPEMISHKENEICFELTDSEETRGMYPFSFRFRTGYSLEGNALHHHFEVMNTGNKTMPFCLGGHPAFRIPFFKNESITDYRLSFEEKETVSRLLLNEEGFFNGETEPVLEDESAISITENLFDDDALVFEDLKSRRVSIESKNHAKKLTVAFGDFPMLGIWAQPGAKFVCIEPWIGRADDAGDQIAFDEKPGIMNLPSGEVFRASFSIIVE
jgi:galactose mutarotase-like enzyme